MESPRKTPRKRKRLENTVSARAEAYFEPLDKQITEITNKTHKCKLCNETYNCNKSCNFANHLSRRHVEIYEKITDLKESPAVKRLKLLQNCTEIVSVNGRSFECLHDSGFQKIIESQLTELKLAGQGLNLSDHGLTEVKEHLKKTAQKIREMIRDEVKGRCLSLLVDAVTKQGRSILGVSIQYAVNGHLKIRSIGMIELNQKHTGKYLAEVIIKRLEELGIKLVQIMTITTDNGSNVLKMVRDLDGILHTEVDKAKQSSTITDDVSTNFGQGDDEVDDDTAIDQLIAQPHDTTDDDALNMIIDEVNNQTLLSAISVELEHSGAEFLFDITGMNCAVHTLQLAVKDAMSKMSKSYNNVIELCRIVCKIIRLKSVRIEMEALNIPYKKPRLETATRWGSMFLMVRFDLIIQF